MATEVKYTYGKRGKEARKERHRKQATEIKKIYMKKQKDKKDRR